MIEQITFRELLKDPIFKAWTQKNPRVLRGRQPLRWTVYVQLDGHRWAKKDFPTWQAAFVFLRKILREKWVNGQEVTDAALNCPGKMYAQPYVLTPNPNFDPRKKEGTGNVRKVRRKWAIPPDHKWCPLCRRPTVWGYYPKGHHAMPKTYPSNGDLLRCRICGVRSGFVDRFW